jgi:hypothetical protein
MFCQMILLISFRFLRHEAQIQSQTHIMHPRDERNTRVNTRFQLTIIKIINLLLYHGVA